MIRSRPYLGPRRIIVTVGMGLFVFFSWASFARVDEVTRGQGRVIPSSKAQIVQSSEPASIQNIVVRSGQAVRKGQLLVRLDDTESSSQLGQIAAENRSLAARADRLSREGGGSSGGGADCSGASGAAQAECNDEAALQSVRAAALRSRKSALNAAVRTAAARLWRGAGNDHLAAIQPQAGAGSGRHIGAACRQIHRSPDRADGCAARGERDTGQARRCPAGRLARTGGDQRGAGTGIRGGPAIPSGGAQRTQPARRQDGGEFGIASRGSRPRAAQ